MVVYAALAPMRPAAVLSDTLPTGQTVVLHGCVGRGVPDQAKEPEQLALLAQCQARLVALSEEVSASWDGVTSVSNHGYTESYASGMDMQAYLGKRQSQIVHEVLSAPSTRWMLYQGGVYHPPRRR